MSFFHSFSVKLGDHFCVHVLKNAIFNLVSHIHLRSCRNPINLGSSSFVFSENRHPC